jgi:hypothetical protein
MMPLAGTDAERRSAVGAARELRALGRTPSVQTVWFRPQHDLVRAVHAVLGIAGSVVAVHHHGLGLGLAGGALVLSLLEAAGVTVVGLPLTRRATQNVVAPPIDHPPGAVLLVLTASADHPRDSILDRVARRLRGPVTPGPAGLLDLALAAVAGCAGARLAGAGGAALGVVQLVPTVVLILLFAGFLEAALSTATRSAESAGPSVIAAATQALDARPPRRLAVEALIGGAGEARAPGMRAYVHTRRRTLAPEDVIVVHLVPADGPLRFHVREGERFALRLHPRLIELAAEIPGAAPAESRTVSAARVARGARWPAITLTGDPRVLAPAALRLIAAIDSEVVQARAQQRR